MTPKEELLLRVTWELARESGNFYTLKSIAPIVSMVRRTIQLNPCLATHQGAVTCILAKFFGIKAKNELTLGDRLKLLREKIGYTQARLSSESQVMQQTISQIESGHLHNPTAETLSGLSRALGVTLDELYHGT